MIDLSQIQTALGRASSESSDFDLNPDTVLPPERKLRDAAVLVPLIDRPTGLSLILTKRSSRLKHHPGQIAFPGGKVEDSDASIEQAALREAEEEIGLPQNCVQPIGSLSPHETVTGFVVHPIVAVIPDRLPLQAEESEVAEIFDVPLAQVIDPNQFQIQYRMWQGRRRNYYVVPHGPYYIWGATARILRGFSDRILT